jgi:predicted PurR-regulated permease PerM
MERPNLLRADSEAAELPDMQVDVRMAFQGGLFLLALLAACYAAGEIILPVVLAFVLNLVVLQPAMRVLEAPSRPIMPLRTLF